MLQEQQSKSINLDIGDPIRVLDESGAEICRGVINSYDMQKNWYRVEIENNLPKFVNYPADRVLPI